MGSEARKLDHASQQQQQQPSDFFINDFHQLMATLLQHEEFKTLEKDTPKDGLFSLSSASSMIIFIGESVWHDVQHLQPVLASLTKQNIMVVNMVEAQHMDNIPKSLEGEGVLNIAMPINFQQLRFIVAKLLNLDDGMFRQDGSHNEDWRKDASEVVKYIFRISRELNGVRDTNKLLSLILQKTRTITSADAGSIYVVEWHTDHDTKKRRDGRIVFKITQNESVQQNLAEFTLPINEDSVVGNVVVHESTINIPDLYKLDPDPKKNPYGSHYNRAWDEKLGYQCHSMLTLPMFDISHRVIGVIQLINRKRNWQKKLTNPADFDSEVMPFDEQIVEFAEIVAQQAGIALENALLTEEKEQLFEGFVQASVKAIEQRDPTTSGHSFRVATLSVETVKLINKLSSGRFKDIYFNENQIKEVEYASLLHDFGKLGVREQVLIKAKKLYPWELELLLERFDHIRSRCELEYLQDLINFMQSPHLFPPGASPDGIRLKRDERIRELDDCFNFILKTNEPTVLEQGGFERLKDIANMSFCTDKGCRPYLRSEELKALSVSRGSLTREEFLEIQSHVSHTYEFLRTIPWGRKYANVPQIAAKHHEKLDGSGYPTSASGDEIPVQTRIMTIADIFDALTASDRPYKKAVPVEKALDIINMDVKTGKLDADLFQIFVESKVYETVIKHPHDGGGAGRS